MNINKIRLQGVTNVDLPIIGADPSGPFVLKSADGLGPTERAVFLAKTTQEGGIRQGSRASDKQIVLLVGLQPDWDTGQTAEELRTELYGLLTPPYGLPVGVQLMLGDTVQAITQGDISRFETAIFSQDPQVQIVIDTNYPYFVAPAIQYQLPTKSTVSGKTAIDIENDGTAPAGFWMKIVLQETVAGSLILSDNAAFGQSMEIGGTWEAGDIFEIDTRAGQRGIWRWASGGGARVSALNDLTPASPWLQLHKGDNRLLLNRLAFDWEDDGFGHTPAYWGV
jgi:hypothetical protein